MPNSFLEKLKRGMNIEKMPEINENDEELKTNPDSLESDSLEPEEPIKTELIPVEEKPTSIKENDPEITAAGYVSKEQLEHINEEKSSLVMPASIRIKKPVKKKEPEKKEKKKNSGKRKSKKTSKEEKPKKKSELKVKLIKKPVRISPNAEFEADREKNWPGPEGELVIDLFETDSDIILQSAIAGVNPDDLDISIENDMLKIRGYREKTFKQEDTNYFHQECHWGLFSKEIILPNEIDPGKSKASIKNGILTIIMPKIEKIDRKTLEVIDEDE